MKLTKESKTYNFIWGVKCFSDTLEDMQREGDKYEGVNIDVLLNYLMIDPIVVIRLAYNGLNLWCKVNNQDNPFKDYNEFLLNYDTLGEEGFHEAILTDILESTYLGSSVVSYLEKKFDITVTDIEEKKKAKKKYLEALEKLSSTLLAGDIDKPKSTRVRYMNTKSKNTVTS